VQASRAWSPPTGTLGGIIAEARERVEILRGRREELERASERTPRGPSLREALAAGQSVSVIAEIKRRSPSKGWINPTLSADDQARAYERGGASAVSVLTESLHFGGAPDDLARVRSAVRLPVIKKDFHVDPIQLLEAKALGASAALLIVRALSPDNLARLIDAAASLELEAVVEVRDDDELTRAVALGAEIIGVNSRNLETLVVDATTSDRLVRSVPADRIAVAESGIRSRSDIERVAQCGADAVLVGSSLSGAADAASAVANLAGVARSSRVR
jgi:indole-3-glycerol phosphate synthase